jgi:hypothetical protein
MRWAAGFAAADEAWAPMSRLPVLWHSVQRDEAAEEKPRLLLGTLDGSGDDQNIPW